MALIKCPECGNDVSSLARMCPNCGYNIWILGRNKFARNMVAIGENNSKTLRIGCLVALAILVLPIVYVLIKDAGRKNELDHLKQTGQRAASEKTDTTQHGITGNEPLYATEWIVENGNEPEDDFSYRIYRLSSNEFRGKTELSQPSIVIACINNRTYVWINLISSIDPELGLDKEHAVRIKLDNDKSFAENWEDLINDESIFAPNAIPLARKMAEADSMLIEFTPYNQNTALLRFDLRGLKPHLEELASECGWKLSQKD